MKHRQTRLRRAEGHVEYIILTSIVMICALVAMISLTDSIKLVALERHLCVSCPANMAVEDLHKQKEELKKERAALAGQSGKADEIAAIDRKIEEIDQEIEYRAKRRNDAVEALNDADLRTKERELASAGDRTSDQEATLARVREEIAKRDKKAEADRKALEGLGDDTPEGLDPGALAATNEPFIGPLLPTSTEHNNYYDPLGLRTIGGWFSDYFRIPSGAPLFYDFANYWSSLDFWGVG